MCREVAETYFWPDEKEFNKKRHVLITSGLVFSALIGKLLHRNVTSTKEPRN